jgi:hypothetical protein
MNIKPDEEDIEAIERKYGALPADASDEQLGYYYRLAQIRKLVRSELGQQTHPATKH